LISRLLSFMTLRKATLLFSIGWARDSKTDISVNIYLPTILLTCLIGIWINYQNGYCNAPCSCVAWYRFNPFCPIPSVSVF